MLGRIGFEHLFADPGKVRGLIPRHRCRGFRPPVLCRRLTRCHRRSRSEPARPGNRDLTVAARIQLGHEQRGIVRGERRPAAPAPGRPTTARTPRRDGARHRYAAPPRSNRAITRNESAPCSIARRCRRKTQAVLHSTKPALARTRGHRPGGGRRVRPTPALPRCRRGLRRQLW